MNPRYSLRLAVTAGALLLPSITPIAASPAQARPPSSATGSARANPLFTDSTLAYHAPAFDLIRDADFEPALVQGMSEQRAEVQRIAESKEPPTFQNTIEALERSGALLTRVQRVFNVLVQANTWFKEHGGMTRENGQRFREMVLSKGGTVDADAMYRAFRGRDPEVEPLLIERGLTRRAGSGALSVDRRQFTIAAAALGGRLIVDPFETLRAASSQDAALSPTYAESVEISGLTPDAKQELEVRIARFPPRASGTLWATVCLGDQIFNAALDAVTLGAATGRTPVEERDVRFEVFGAAQTAAALSRRRDEMLAGSARVTVGAHRSADPPPGIGPQAIVIDARFESLHPPVQVLPARLEVMGRVSATVRTPDGTFTIEGPGKWHEQTGNRPRFAAAFTYLTATGTDHGLLAVKRQPAPFGFAWIGREAIKVKTVEIGPPGDRRTFVVELENGRRVDGEARVARTISTPVEGERRPSTTVIVTSSIGPMVGHINDWAG